MKWIYAATAVLFVSSTPAWALGYTPSNASGHKSILDGIFSDSFTGTGQQLSPGVWTSYVSLNGIEVHRAYDFGDQPLPTSISSGDQNHVDQSWIGGQVAVSAVYKNALGYQAFGWNGGGGGASYIELFNESDPFFTESSFNADGTFLFTSLWSDGQTLNWWSLPSLNSDGMDHMITYRVTFPPLLMDEPGAEPVNTDDPGELARWLIFIEDVPQGSSDLDYDDYVIFARALTPAPAVPAPSCAALLLLCLAGRRRARRQDQLLPSARE